MTPIRQHQNTLAVKAPAIVDGYISRTAMSDFFTQIHGTTVGAASRIHALHSRLTIAIMFGALKLDARCENCQRGIHEVSCSPKIGVRHNHCRNEDRHKMEISAQSIRELAPEEFLYGAKLTGPAIYGDYMLLRTHL